MPDTTSNSGGFHFHTTHDRSQFFFPFPLVTLHSTVSGSTLRVSHRDNQRVGIETVYWISQVLKYISSYMPQLYFNFASPSHPYH